MTTDENHDSKWNMFSTGELPMSAGPRVVLCGIIIAAAYVTASALHTNPNSQSDQLASGETAANTSLGLAWQAPSEAHGSVHATPDGEARNPALSPGAAMKELPAPPPIPPLSFQEAPTIHRRAIPSSPDRPVVNKAKPARGAFDPENKMAPVTLNSRPKIHSLAASGEPERIPSPVKQTGFEQGPLQAVERNAASTPGIPRSAAEKVERHTVLQNETLQSISKRYFGDPGRYLDLYRANQDVLDNPAELKPGTVLRIELRQVP